MTEHTLICSESGVRLDKFIADADIGVSRSAAVGLIESGGVSLNGERANKKQKLKTGDEIKVVNKPKGMVVHPAAGNYDGTLVNALLYHCGDSLSGINGVLRPGIVHRIDKDTSGLLIVAKNDESHKFLSGQIKEHSFTREYEAVVWGSVREDEGTVNAPIGRNPNDRKKMWAGPTRSASTWRPWVILWRAIWCTVSKTRRWRLRDSAFTRRKSGLYIRQQESIWSLTQSFPSTLRIF